MSRQIDLTKKLSDEDRQHLVDRSMLREIEQNDVMFGVKPADVPAVKVAAQPATELAGPPPPDDDPDADWLEAWTVTQLKQELDKRDVAYPNDAKKADLKDRLYEILEDEDEEVAK